MNSASNENLETNRAEPGNARNSWSRRWRESIGTGSLGSAVISDLLERVIEHLLVVEAGYAIPD